MYSITFSKFYDTASYPNNCLVPQTLPSQGLPPSYEAVMASEKEFLQDLKQSVSTKANQTRWCRHKMAKSSMETLVRDEHDLDLPISDSNARSEMDRQCSIKTQKVKICSRTYQLITNKHLSLNSIQAKYSNDSADENGNKIESAVCFIVNETNDGLPTNEQPRLIFTKLFHIHII